MAQGYSRELVDSVIKAYDVRGLVGEQITVEMTAAIGNLFGGMVAAEGAGKIVVGYDMRPSSPELAQAFAEGATAAGVDVVIVGLASTDELYYAAGVWDCPGAMFTASHNPAAYNGIKLCRAGAKPVSTKTGLGQIADGLVDGTVIRVEQPGEITHVDVLDDYAEFLLSLVDLSQIRPLKVAVDAANGMAGHTVERIFRDTPVEVLPLYFELDGTFPNHEANPLEPENLVDLQKFVLEQGADIGLAFDGDADRCFIVDNTGAAVSPSIVTALVATSYLRKYPGAKIIHNLICSRAVPETIEAHGGVPIRTRVGHSYIKATMAEENAVFGGEHSAHYYFTEFFNADSGLLAALHVLAMLGSQEGTMAQLAAEVGGYVPSGEINTRLESAAEVAAKTEQVLAAFADRIEAVDRLDGVTVILKEPGSWFNVRASNTEPLLRLNVETRTTAGTDALVAEILGIIRGTSNK